MHFLHLEQQQKTNVWVAACLAGNSGGKEQLKRKGKKEGNFRRFTTLDRVHAAAVAWRRNELSLEIALLL